jgi:hypothetical protein
VVQTGSQLKKLASNAGDYCRTAAQSKRGRFAARSKNRA